MPNHTSLKGWSNIGHPGLSDQLETNLVTFFNWGFLGIGGFFNVEIPASGAYGGNRHQLSPVRDPNYMDGQVWQGYRQDWVWETGVERVEQPIRVSGVNVDGSFHDINATGTYMHHVNYPLGRVVFNAPIPTTSTVQCEYSYRQVQFTTADAPWWREVQKNSFRIDDPHFEQQGSGVWHTLSQSRIQLPAVVVESVPRITSVGKQLGDLTRIVTQDVVFHIVAETHWDRKQLHDIITGQQDKRIIAFDKQRMYDANAFPLDDRGSPVPSGKMYPDLVKSSGDGGFGWEQLRFMNFQSSDAPPESTAPLYYATVRGTFEIDLR